MFLMLLACATPETETPANEVTGLDPNDLDGDGVATSMDCDDMDASVWMDREWAGTLTNENLAEICTATCSLTADAVYLESPETLEGLSCLTAVGGSFEIHDLRSTDLLGLEQLEGVGGNLYIEGENLETLNGLASLVSVGGLEVVGPEFRSLAPVPELTHIGTLRVMETPSLRDFTGLQGLDAIGQVYVSGVSSFGGLQTVLVKEVVASDLKIQSLGELYSGALGTLEIDGAPDLKRLNLIPPSHLYWLSLKNTGLEDLQEMRTLQRVSVYLHLEGNPNLESLHGLEALTECPELVLGDNDAMVDLSGLGKIAEMDSLTLFDMSSLRSLDGLESLEELGDLSIYRNANLVDLQGLYGLTRVESLTIANNAALSAEEAEALLDAIGRENIQGEIIVQGI